MKYGILAFVFLLSFASCEKDQKDELEGKWLLKTVVDTAGVTHTVDTVWYNIQNTLFMYQLYDVSAGGTYPHQYGFKTRPDNKTVVFELTDNPRSIPDFLPYTDWKEASRTFTIEKATGSQLILSSEGKQYLFHKF